MLLKTSFKNLYIDSFVFFVMIKAQLSGEKISSASTEAFTLYEKSKFGEKKQGKITYSDVEAIYLVSIGKMEVYTSGKLVSEEKLISKVKRKDKKIEIKSAVFSDLRKKGYVVKSALKFGAEFRVYDKGSKPGEAHARWILFVARENERVQWHEFAAKSRVAHSTKKKLLLGVVDSEGDPTYYEVGWTKV